MWHHQQVILGAIARAHSDILKDPLPSQPWLWLGDIGPSTMILHANVFGSGHLFDQEEWMKPDVGFPINHSAARAACAQHVASTGTLRTYVVLGAAEVARTLADYGLMKDQDPAQFITVGELMLVPAEVFTSTAYGGNPLTRLRRPHTFNPVRP